ncbi:MAG: 1-acyl-sn-glycerol-3-phosphate acyltransferase [Anaerolineales bacterium]|nr:1-acyl-sn-glycerol-3-phosphate acyltransferase [Anaerolineales bacterium]
MAYYAFLRLLIFIILLFIGKRTVHGAENIPATGPYIIVVNHMSKADTPLLYCSLPLISLRFFAGEKWQEHWLFGPMLKYAGAIYIDRGTVDRRALREALASIEAGSVFALAPEGQRSQVGYLLEGKDGAAFLASKARVPILPVGIENSDILGANVKRLRRTHVHVRFGEPFYLPEPEGRLRSSDMAAYTHLIMIHIANQLPPRYHGVYADCPALAALQRGEEPWPYCLEPANLTGRPT